MSTHSLVRTLRAPSEQQVLSLSVFVTLAIAGLGILFGLSAGSHAILFDGAFDAADAAMSLLALWVSRLLLRSGSRRFQYGYWHFEPLVALFNSTVLLLMSVYALWSGVRSLGDGGHAIALDLATLYAVVVCAGCFGLYAYERRVNRVIRSEFIRIDMSSFLMSGATTLGMLISFAGAQLAVALGWAGAANYVDAIILISVAVLVLPLPLSMMRRALREVFLMAPSEVTAQVEAVMAQAQQTHGFIDHRFYIAKVGRLYKIDIHVQVPDDCPQSVRQFDDIRAEIAAPLAAVAQLDEWLSISFTTRPQWT